MKSITGSDDLRQWDPPSKNLAHAAKQGVYQTTLFRLLSLLVQFVAAAILARLLGPEAFGTIALASLVTGFATIFNDMGIGSAIIQRQDLDQQTLSAAFWMNVAIGFVLSVIITSLTPVMANFFNSPDLLYVLPLSSLTLLLSISLVQKSLLQRKMNFKAVMLLDFLYGALSALVSVGLVFAGVGVAAVPIGAVVATGICTIAAALMCPWRPRTRPTLASVKELWQYSGHVLAFNIINYWSKNVDNLVVGKFLGNVPLGLYSRAYNLMQLPVTNLNRVLTTVLFPALSSVKLDPVRFRNGWILSCRAGLVIGIFITSVVAVASPYLVEILYGKEWLSMSTTLTLLIAATPAYILSSNASPIFLALAKTRMQFRLGLATSLLRVCGILIGLLFGLNGVAASILITGYLNLLITTWPAMRLVGIKLRTLARSLAWIVLAGVFAAEAGILLRMTVHAHAGLSLLLITSIMTSVYAAILLVFERSLLKSLRRGQSAA
ncbi:lipopolysaccharide biosynthesis protein [Actinomycetes bacterium M1A6_2h]